MDNLGLKECIQNFNMNEVYSQHCSKVSLADFFIIAGEAVMGRTAGNYNAEKPFASGTYLGQLRDSFKWGRTTLETCEWNKGLMPNPLDGCKGLGAVFIDHIYKESEFPWALTAAISGAHTLGSARISTSGFDGFWSDAENQGKFNNNYYRSLMLKGWEPEYAINGVDGKN